jgi:adenine-specific DNA-methyltransferase
MNDAYFKNNAISISQRRYLGSKTKLLNFIDDILQKENIEFKSFADIFAGTGTVANHFYGNSNIIVNDILKSNNYIYHAFFGGDEIREGRLKDHLKFYNELNINKYSKNYFSENFSNTYFDAKTAKNRNYKR